ncbi:MAG: acetate--CoA ligase family protein [archaeon]
MLLEQKKVQSLLNTYKIAYVPTLVINNTLPSKKLKFPVVLKVDSKEVIHKSDLGLVFTNIMNLNEIGRKMKTATTILKMHGIKDYSFLIQEMIQGTELIIGMKRDKTFGPVIMLGLGGVFVEVMKDISMRIAPVSKFECYSMIEELKGKKLLSGYRGSKPVNKEKIVDIMLRLSALSLKETNIEEIDFNPVMADDKNAVVVDARVIDGA